MREYKPPTAGSVHWDEKCLPELDNKNKTVERMPVIVSGTLNTYQSPPTHWIPRLLLFLKKLLKMVNSMYTKFEGCAGWV